MAATTNLLGSEKGSEEGSETLSLRADDLEMDDSSLTAKLFLPARAQLALAQATVADLTDPAEAWETLAARGVVSPEWISDSDRVFAEAEVPPALERGGSGQPSYEGIKQYLENGPRLCDVPPTVEFATLLASDVVGIETAEQVARETVRRLEPWGCPQSHRIAWRLVQRETWETQPGDYRHMTAAVAVGGAFRPLERSMPALVRARKYAFGTPEWRAAYSWECAAQWRELSRREVYIPSTSLEWARNSGYPEVPSELKKKRFSELPNPFEPLLSLWAAGYALDVITPSVIVLALPHQRAPSKKSNRTRK